MLENGTIKRSGQVCGSGKSANVSLVVCTKVNLFCPTDTKQKTSCKDSLRKRLFDCKTVMNDTYKAKEKVALNNVNDGRMNS